MSERFRQEVAEMRDLLHQWDREDESKRDAMSTPQPSPYTRESIQKAKQHQQWERLQAARDMGIPSALVDLYWIEGFDQMDVWVAMIKALRRD